MSSTAVRTVSATSLTDGSLDTLLQRGEPFVLTGAIETWAARKWDLETLSREFGEAPVCVRLHPRELGEQPRCYFEGECAYLPSSMANFCSWLARVDGGESSSLGEFSHERFIGYADYQDMVRLLPSEALSAVDWSSVTGVDRDGMHSTLWLGSEGAHTPTHYDTFGLNFVAQIVGSKRWRLHPPSAGLAPTRVPYEESSVYAEAGPDAGTALPGALTIDLQPGQVLHVPKHWWHTVQTVSCHALSINTWIDAPGDDADRLREALVRLLVSSILVASGRAHPDAGQGNEAGEGDSSEAAVTTSEGLEDDAPACGWVNPTEQLWSAADNLDALRVALAACVSTGTSDDEEEEELDIDAVAQAVCTGAAIAAAAHTISSAAGMAGSSTLQAPLSALIRLALFGSDPAASSFADFSSSLSRLRDCFPHDCTLTLRDVVNAVSTGHALEVAVSSLLVARRERCKMRAVDEQTEPEAKRHRRSDSDRE